MKVEHTERGFEIINFIDQYKEQCSLQQSSLAIYEQPGASAVWLGPNEQRMHLTLEMVQDLIPHLQNWVETGSF